MSNITKLVLVTLVSISQHSAFAQDIGVNSGSLSARQQTNNTANENYSKGRRDRNIGIALMSNIFTITPGIILVVKGINQMKQGKATATVSGYSRTSVSNSSYKGKDFELNTARSLSDFQKEIDQYKKDLEKFGYKYDDKTGGVITPDGNNWNENTFSGTAEEVAFKAGISEDQAQKALDELKKNKDKPLDKSDMKVSAVGGGAGGAAAAATNAPEFDPNSLFSGRPTTRAIANAKTTGLTKNIGGDTVGTAQDNIFQMVNRKYENKKSESFFIEGDWGYK